MKVPFCLFCLVILLDRTSKVIGRFFTFGGTNAAGAWGTGTTNQFFWIGVGFLGMAITAIWVYHFGWKSSVTRFGLGVFLGGALSNLIDRIIWGGVYDFIPIGVLPHCNIADAAISFGAILILCGYLLKDIILFRE